MKQGIQETLKNKNIHECGCYFLSLLEWAARDRQVDMDAAEIELLYDTSVKNGYMRVDCFMWKPEQVYNLAFHKQKFIGKESVKAKPASDTYIIAWEKPGYTHFTLVYKGESWDSKPPDRRGKDGGLIAKTYSIGGYRVLV